MKLGLDVFLEIDYKRFRGKRIGLLTNTTGVNLTLKPSIDLFVNHPEINIVALYAPEHGIRGDAKEGESIQSSTDSHTGLPIHSLYGESKKPTKEMLSTIDVVVFDLQDIGSRYYTFIYTMAYMMEACNEYGKEFVVLDRPNPIGGLKVEGNLVEDDCRSFVSLLPIPNRHGLTVGELAKVFKNEFNYNCALTVIPMKDWSRARYFDETGLFWVPPSPNAPSLDMAMLYPGTCLFEGTNISEGRGTTKPFEMIGAPFIDGYTLTNAFNKLSLPGVVARPTSFKPTYKKYENEVCSGIQLHVTNRHTLNSYEMGLKLIDLIAKIYPAQFVFLEHSSGRFMFDLLAGTKSLKDKIIAGEEIDFFLNQCQIESAAFKRKVKPYLLY
ncbi:exo-beta-N-acetylmuramidase NamZ family protein [Shouchella patagoniensis]|uniref:exo-beta-N-acetylmuramidase NamZ family protein n=1 Tax=Shouchella patagoniensis TaxID=228576 RepID=UPI0011164E02|nr:DUF1343 domain-containing protein [Shouchella patagoniensis]